MKCPFCGEEIEDTSAYCGMCGRKIVKEEEEQNVFVKQENKMSDKVSVPTKKKKRKIWKVIVFIIIVVFISTVIWMVIQIKKVKSYPYTYSPVVEKTVACIDQITGNKNTISVPEDKKEMKYMAERISGDILRQMKNGKALGVPKEVQENAEKFSNIKSGKIKQIEYFSELRSDVSNQINNKKDIDIEDIMSASIPCVVGRQEDLDGLNLTSAFHLQMDINEKREEKNSVWLLKYTEKCSIGVVFLYSKSKVTVEAYPLYTKDMKNVCNEMELLYKEHRTYK